MAPAAPRRCRTCGELVRPGRSWHGECPRCANYRLRHGVARSGLDAPVRCRECGLLVYPGRKRGYGVGYTGLRLCHAHYQQVWRRRHKAQPQEVA